MAQGIRPDAGLGLIDSRFANGITQGDNLLFKATLTANPGGAQATATQISPAAAMVRVNVVATAADSVKLPFAMPGNVKMIVNDGANAMAVFARNGNNRLTSAPDTINALANNVAISVAAGKSILFFCPVPGKWFGILSA